MAKYFYINDEEYKLLIKKLNDAKSQENYELKKNLEYQFKKLSSEDNSYVLAAKNTLYKNFAKYYENEEIILDDDANVSATENGAYVQCWLWVDSNLKNKKIKKDKK